MQSQIASQFRAFPLNDTVHMVTVMDTSHLDQSRDTVDPRLPGRSGRRDSNGMFP